MTLPTLGMAMDQLRTDEEPLPTSMMEGMEHLFDPWSDGGAGGDRLGRGPGRHGGDDGNDGNDGNDHDEFDGDLDDAFERLLRNLPSPPPPPRTRTPSPPPLPPPPCEERDVARPSQRTVARLFELLPQRERDRFGAWALQQPYASSATWRDGGAMLARFEWFGWRDLHAAFRDLALPVEPASAVDSRDAGRTRNLWSDVPESGAAAATAPAGREYLDEAECRFRQTALALLAREGDWYYYGSR